MLPPFSESLHTYVRPFYGPLDFVRDYLGEPVQEPIWILLKQETVIGSCIRWGICKSAPCSRQITTPAPHHSVFLQAGWQQFAPCGLWSCKNRVCCVFKPEIIKRQYLYISRQCLLLLCWLSSVLSQKIGWKECFQR